MRYGPRRLVVDPPGCGCLDCITHYSVPADELTDEHLALIQSGSRDWDDRTWWDDEPLDKWLQLQQEDA